MVAHLFKFQSMNDYSSVNEGFFSGTGRSSFLVSTLRKVYRGKFWNGYVEKFGERGIFGEALNVRWQKDDGSLRKKRIDFSYEKTAGY